MTESFHLLDFRIYLWPFGLIVAILSILQLIYSHNSGQYISAEEIDLRSTSSIISKSAANILLIAKTPILSLRHLTVLLPESSDFISHENCLQNDSYKVLENIWV
jgi:hypothetical protein